MTIQVIGLDADDTLWHSEDGFHSVTARFCELRRAVRRSIPRPGHHPRLVERRNMVLFGYGVKSFTLSMVEAAIEVSGGQVPAETIQRLVDEGRTLLSAAGRAVGRGRGDAGRTGRRLSHGGDHEG